MTQVQITCHIYQPQLQFMLQKLGFPAGSLRQLRRGTANGKLPCFLHLHLEDDLLSILPHFGDKCLAGQNGAREAHLNVLEGAEPSTLHQRL